MTEQPLGTPGEILLSAEQIRERIGELGAEISEAYAGEVPLLVGVLKGALIVMSDLSRAITTPVELDFMAVSSYGASTRSSGVVRIIKDLDADISGRHVLIVEDIIDSGLTLNFLRRTLGARGPASLEVAALLVRDGRQKSEQDLKFVGFEIPPDFVVGYGLDVAERFRNLPDLHRYNPTT